MTEWDAVSVQDGIRIDLASGETFVADARRPDADVVAVSHAHGDHLYSRAPDGVICSPLTAALAAERRSGEGSVARTTHPSVELVSAGHIPGSRATIVEDEDGTTYCYTGDFSTRDRFLLDGLDPAAVAAAFDVDVLILETTYGKPQYVFDEQATLERRILDWLDDVIDRPVLLFGYTLGRAQELELLVDRSDRERLFVTEPIERLNDVIEAHRDVDFGARRYDADDVTLGAGDALVLPTGANRGSLVPDVVERTGALTAGFTGWAHDRSYQYRTGYDETFVLSDHADFSELTATVETIDPERVYTNHGFADEFAGYLDAEHDVAARSLERTQSHLGEFG